MTSLERRSRGEAVLQRLVPVAMTVGLAALVSRAMIADGRRDLSTGSTGMTGASARTTGKRTQPAGESRGAEATQGARPSWGWDGTAWW